MHVKLVKITTLVVSTEITKQGARIRRQDPKDGWWKVVWVRKRNNVKDVSGILTKRKAQGLADVLNILSKQQVVLLVSSLHARGVEAHREYERKNPRYTGRSFAH